MNVFYHDPVGAKERDDITIGYATVPYDKLHGCWVLPSTRLGFRKYRTPRIYDKESAEQAASEINRIMTATPKLVARTRGWLGVRA
jgi:hypothetical protein